MRFRACGRRPARFPVQPPAGPSGENKQPRPREGRLEPLPPLVSAALEPTSTSLAERLGRIATQGHGHARYTVLGEVARGGMGRILRAWDEALSREVAMKVVPREPARGSSDEERSDHEHRLARFLDEARITAQLDHPGIVPVYEIGLDPQGAVFFTMPLVRGETLKHVFEHVHRGENGWTLQRALDVLHKVCLTVAFAHTKGVVHRDLKPENVMVGPFGEAYVMDWGLALLLGRSERGGIIGTPAYMAPEQATGKSGEVGPPADVYSLGAILYELFARRMPHQVSLETRAHTGESLESVLAMPPRPLHELDSEVPRELAAICAKAMAADPRARYATALEMADDLEAWLSGHTVSALESGPWTRFVKWRARNRSLALALDAFAASLLVGAAAFVWQERLWVKEVQAKHHQALISGYAAGIAAADLGLRAHEAGESRRRLEACDKDLRGWEWRHLELRADVAARTLYSQHGAVRAVAVSPDGRRIAAGCDDGTLVLWDADTGALQAELGGRGAVLTAVSFAPDGARLAAASRDKRVRVWRADGTLEHVFDEHDSSVEALAFDGAGRVLATGDDDGRIQLLAMETGALLAQLVPGARERLVGLRFVPGTELLAAADVTGSVRLLGPDLVVRAEKLSAPSGLSALDVEPGGARLAVACERSVLLLDSATLETVQTLAGHGGKVSGVAFAPDGQHLATCGYDNVLRLWDLASEKSECEYDGHDRDVNAVAFFPDGRRLVTGAEDETLRLWDISRAAMVVLDEAHGWVNALALAPDGHELAVGGQDRELRVFALESGALRASTTTSGTLDCLAWSPTGWIAFGCGEFAPRLVHADDLAPGPELAPGTSPPRTLVFSVDGTRLFARDTHGTISVYEPAYAALVGALATDDDMSFSLATTRDGSVLAAGTHDGDVLLWDARSLAPLAHWPGEKPGVTALAFAPDGAHLAVARASGQIELYAFPRGVLERTLDGHETFAACLAFSPDGKRLASGAYDHTVRLWGELSDQALLTLLGHDEPVTAVAFDTSGEILASASKDQRVRLWRTARSFGAPGPALAAGK
ncbi:MAG: hypothetical protein EXS08_16135 [Planctomycetes bacterium]|nr:hypothetical protein [Planctomycetota bacterium]